MAEADGGGVVSSDNCREGGEVAVSKKEVDGQSRSRDLCLLRVVDVREGNTPCCNGTAFPITSFGASKDCASACCLTPMHEAGGDVEGNFQAMIDGGAKKCLDGSVWNL